MFDYQQWDHNRFYGYSGNKNPWFPQGRPAGPPQGRTVRERDCPCVRGWNLDENGRMPEPDGQNNDLYAGDMAEQERMEEEWLYMKQLYPNKARKLLRYIEDAADRMEYGESMMFDERPEQISVDRLVQDVMAVIEDTEPELINRNGNNNQNTTWDECSEILVYVLLITEMHHRRRRYFMMQNRNY